MAQSPLVAVVDDDPSARDAAASLIRALGFAVAVFESAADFLKSADVPQTACLIADVQMPRMTGLALHRHLVASGTPIPTVLVTAYPDERIRAQALSGGVTCYLAKPFKPDDLLTCIRSALENRADGPSSSPKRT